MPRRMARFDIAFSRLADSALEIVKAGETMRMSGASGKKAWTITRLESLYELAFLRVFAAWEACQELVFIRSLCGCASAKGQETLRTGAHFIEPCVLKGD
jgi:hypothetical protein